MSQKIRCYFFLNLKCIRTKTYTAKWLFNRKVVKDCNKEILTRELLWRAHRVSQEGVSEEEAGAGPYYPDAAAFHAQDSSTLAEAIHMTVCAITIFLMKIQGRQRKN